MWTTYVGNWYDAANKLTYTANYGTDGRVPMSAAAQ